MIKDRLDAIRTLGREIMNPARLRRDSRIPTPPAFGRRPRPAATAYPQDPSGRPLEQPRPPARNMLLLYFTDRELYRQWHNASVAWAEWQLRERRNLLGLTSKMIIPVAATCLAVLYIYWPGNGNLSRLVTTFSPTAMVDIARETNSGPFCSGPSYPDGKCPGAKSELAARDHGQAGGNAPAGGVPASKVGDGGLWSSDDRPMLPASTVPLLLFAFVVIAIVKPSLLRSLFGVVEPKTDSEQLRSASSERDQGFSTSAPPKWNVPKRGQSATSSSAVSFGRRKA